MNDVSSFYAAIRKRSDENKKALDWLLQEQIYSLVGSIIRMELDSLFRLCYFKSRREQEKTILMEQFLKGQRWKGEKRLITDAKMRDHFARSLGLLWAIYIYEIGCAFIHLSPYHDWNNSNDPTRNISEDVRKIIVNDVYEQHQKQLDINFDFYDLVGVASPVFDKLRSNLLYYLK